MKRTSVPFEHDTHNENADIYECNLCHHVYEDGKLLEDESSEDSSCSDCHDLEEKDGDIRIDDSVITRSGINKILHKPFTDEDFAAAVSDFLK